jgi:hypothetical protein
MATKKLPFYNVSQSVGPMGTNKSEDVLLVQFFLSEIGKVPPHPLPPPPVPLAVNGQVSPVLGTWILWFQNCVKAAGKPVIVDGRVDPWLTPGADWKGSSATIVHLNATFRRRFRDAHNALENAAHCPSVLRSKFQSQDVS